MTTIADRFGGVILVALLGGIPLGVLAVVLLARRRAAGGWGSRWAWRSSAAEVGLVVGTLPWIWMITTPTSGEGGLQLVPFRDLAGVVGGRHVVTHPVTDDV
ncbi:MAG: hypothetical protein ABWX66_05350 [Lacisediminihabitans sp.]